MKQDFAQETRKVELTVRVEFGFENTMTDEDINFYLNESGFCLGTLLDKVNEYAEEHNGCVCEIATARVLPKEEVEQ